MKNLFAIAVSAMALTLSVGLAFAAEPQSDTQSTTSTTTTAKPKARVSVAQRRANRRAHLKRVLVRRYARFDRGRQRWGWSHALLRRKLRTARAEARFSRVQIPAILHRIAMCESHGNPRAIGGGGTYRGKYQFSFSTWRSVGGSGDPAAASEREQDYRALLLLRRSGTAPWPVCGR